MAVGHQISEGRGSFHVMEQLKRTNVLIILVFTLQLLHPVPPFPKNLSEKDTKE